MKKVFKSMIVVLSFLSMGMLTTSCEEGGILSQILGNLFGQTETYNYMGSGTSECLTGSYLEGKWNYINSSTPSKLTTTPVKLECKNSKATLTLPAYTDGKVTINGVTFYDLDMTASADNSYTALSVNDSQTEGSRIEGSVVYGGKTHKAGTVFIESAKATSETMILKMTLYFLNEAETDYDFAINFTYNGKIVTE